MEENKKYSELHEVRSLDCGAGPCPSVYEVRKDCGFAACPSVNTADSEKYKDKYLVVGRQLSSEEVKELGLGKKVGQGESVVEVPKSLLEELGE